MLQRGRYLYSETGDFQQISLPYGDQQRFCMDIILPKGSAQPDQLLGYFMMQDKPWLDWGISPQMKKGSIALPKFTLDCSYKLKEVLSAMGMSVAFSGMTADFSEMADPLERVHISQVLHKTKLEVTEQGTKAAGATVVGGVRSTSVDPDRPFNMEVDRPFVCAIRDTSNNVLHFLGIISNPQ
jgi:serpin B